MFWQDADPYATLIVAMDGVFMRLYAHARRNARRITRLAITLLPLVMLLVSSCKTASLSGSYSASTQAEQVRTALFPDQMNNARRADYRPADGYIALAKNYVANAPEALKLLSSREIGYLFGKPSLARKDADAKVWQYRAKTCIVDFYFYDAGVSYVDVRLRDAAPSAALPEKMQAQCIGHVLNDGSFSDARA